MKPYQNKENAPRARRAAMRGSIGAEAVIIVMFMATLLMAAVDAGNIVLIQKRVAAAAGAVAMALPQEGVVSRAGVEAAIVAGRMVVSPYSQAQCGIDISAVRSGRNGGAATTQWQETSNMRPVPGVAEKAGAYGGSSGVIAVTVQYVYAPVLLRPFKKSIYLRRVVIRRAPGGLIAEAVSPMWPMRTGYAGNFHGK